jgi:hypothetical protein
VGGVTNPSKVKGSLAERQMVAWLVENGFPLAHRSRAGWSNDIGDVLGCGQVIEVKNAKTARWGEWLAELDVEKVNAGMSQGVLVVRRSRITDPGDWLAVRRVRDEFLLDTDNPFGGQ